jgi:hypothetical protein
VTKAGAFQRPEVLHVGPQLGGRGKALKVHG